MFSKADIEKYFAGEKKGGGLFLLLGILAVLAAITLFFLVKGGFYEGASIPFLVIGILMTVTGYVVYRRSDGDRIRNVYAYDMNPAELRQKELPRMKKVMQNFIILRYTEIFLFLAGAALYIYFIRDLRNDFWRGLGMGLTVTTLTALIADHFAETRAREYTRGLEAFVSKS